MRGIESRRLLALELEQQRFAGLGPPTVRTTGSYEQLLAEQTGNRYQSHRAGSFNPGPLILNQAALSDPDACTCTPQWCQGAGLEGWIY